MKTIGITTTVPTEILLAAGYNPVDLNNLFITNPDKERLVNIAERDGFPTNCCTWIKGIYGVCIEYRIDTVLCVTGGDCSNTLMLVEVLNLKGINALPFSYPDHPDVNLMQKSLEKLTEMLGTTLGKAEDVRRKLNKVRMLAHKLDDLTWRDGVVSGWENHLWLVSTSDFIGDVAEYKRRLQGLLSQTKERSAYPDDFIRLAYIGVPSVFTEDFYHYLERNGARVVFNETQRQFAMPDTGSSLAKQYCNYTYPYSTSYRLSDIMPQLRQRQIDGVIHYVQAFCHRGISDIIFRHTIDLPTLTLEGNADFTLTHQLRTRIEAFLEMLCRPGIKCQ
ncbi:2-hydroxyacyl-CoA dehydratase family protein [Chloroflexota bacterium]